MLYINNTTFSSEVFIGEQCIYCDSFRYIEKEDEIFKGNTILIKFKNGGIYEGHICVPIKLTEFQEQFQDELLKTNKSFYSGKPILDIKIDNLCSCIEQQHIRM